MKHLYIFFSLIILINTIIPSFGQQVKKAENGVFLLKNATLHTVSSSNYIGDAVSVTNDFDEHGDFVPHMKALTAVNPNAVAIPVTRVNGVTTVFAKPDGGTFPGTGALIDLFGYSPEQMTCGSERVIMRFPSTGRRGRWDRRTDEDVKKDAEKRY